MVHVKDKLNNHWDGRVNLPTITTDYHCEHEEKNSEIRGESMGLFCVHWLC